MSPRAQRQQVDPQRVHGAQETFKWAQTDTLWAPDVAQLPDGRFYMYTARVGDSPLSALGVAVADDIEGPSRTSGSSSHPADSGRRMGAYDATGTRT